MPQWREKATCGGLNNVRNCLQISMRLVIGGGIGVTFWCMVRGRIGSGRRPSGPNKELTNTEKTQLAETIWGATDTDAICLDVFWDIEMLDETTSERCSRFQIKCKYSFKLFF